MELLLHDRVAVVTGGASGIGRSTAVAFAREGCRVIIADVDEPRMDETVAAVASSNGRARAVRCDVTDQASVDAALGDVARGEGRLDIVVSCAGVAPRLASLVESGEDDWDRMLDVHLRGTRLVNRGALRLMLEQRARGAIVNVASIAALRAAPSLAPYAAAKAAVVQLTRTLAREVAARGVRVNAVCPGWIETPLLGSLDRAPIRAETPLGRLGTPDEIANVIVFLSSDAASFVTGSVIVADGGLLA